MSHRLLFLPIGNDCNLVIAHVHNVLSATLVQSANIFFTIVVSGTSTTASGQTWPSSMTLINSETALWAGPIMNSMQLTEGVFYQALITADAGIGTRGFWRLPIKAVVRED